VQVDPIKPRFKAPGSKRFTLRYDEPLSNVAFKFNLRRHNEGRAMSFLYMDEVYENFRKDKKTLKVGVTRVIRCTAFWCSPRHPPRSAPVLGARRVIYHIVYQ